MPHTGEPVPGIKIKIVEYKQKSKWYNLKIEEKETGWTLECETDAYGKLSGSFMGVLKTNHVYYMSFDYSGITKPPGVSEFWIDGPSSQLMRRGKAEDKFNTYEIKVLPYTNYHLKVENTNCFDANDEFRLRGFNYDVDPDFAYLLIHGFGTPLNGCGVLLDVDVNHVVAGHYVKQTQVTRNGITTLYTDTFNVIPGQPNEMLIQY